MKITMRDGTVITEKRNENKGTYEYYLGKEFIFGVFEKFKRDDLQNLYDLGYFETEKMEQFSPSLEAVPTKTTTPRVKASLKYNEKNVKQVKLALNLKTDADIISWLEQRDNVQGYIKGLIRDDMP